MSVTTAKAGNMGSRRRELAIGVGCAFLTVFNWTAFLLLSRHGVKGSLTPFDMSALRFGISGLIMVPFLLRIGLAGLRLWQVLVLTLCAGPIFTTVSFFGFSMAPASYGSIMPGLLPLWAALLAWLVLGSRMQRRQLVCLAVILAGVLVFAASAVREAPPGTLLGVLIFPIAPFAWAVFTILCRRWQVTPLRATAVVAVGSMLLFLPPYLLWLPKGVAETPAAEVLVQGLFQGFVAVIANIFIYTRAVIALGPVVTTMITAVVPGLVAVLAVPLLGEPLTPLAALGVVLLSLGMVGAVLALRTG